METREFWFLASLLIIALSAAISLVVSVIYVPLQKFPSAIRDNASFWYQKLYLFLVFSLFATLIGLGVYVPLRYELLHSQDVQEIIRSALFLVFTVSLFFVTLSFKKQALSTARIAAHAFIVSALLVVATQEETLNFFAYPYILLILALFAIVRYGVNAFIKKL